MNYVIVDEIIRRAFEEDFPYGDITSETLIDSEATLNADLIGKETGVVAGLEVFERVYALLGSVSCGFFCKDKRQYHQYFKRRANSIEFYSKA